MSKAERVAVVGVLIASLMGVVTAWVGSAGGDLIAGVPAFAVLVAVAFGINIAAFVPT